MMRVLVIEPDSASRRNLRDLLAGNGFEVVEADNAEAAGEANANRIGTLIANAALLDENLIALAEPVPVVLLADSPSVSQAVDCMRRGAADYLAKSADATALMAAIAKAVAGDVPGAPKFSPMIGDCPPMRELGERILAAARTTTAVLFQGEPGTGKALAARVLHEASERRYGRLIGLNCAATPAPSIEPALFGFDLAAAEPAASSAGLIEAAHGGTMFIAAVALMPAAAQSRLLRFLDEGTVGAQSVDVRVVAASHLDLRQLAGHGHFNNDLLRRLHATTLPVPPLRERGEDIVRIANAVLERVSRTLNKRGLKFADRTVDALRRHRWPGNVRELENAVERATALCDGPVIAANLFAEIDRDGDRIAATDPKQTTSGSLEDFFVRFVLANQDQFTETELASQLGISRKSLWERRQRLNIPRRRTRTRGPRQEPSAGVRDGATVGGPLAQAR